jgi:hypothetical protein
MVTVTCQECGREIEVNDHYVDGMIAAGDLVRGDARIRVPSYDLEPDGSIVDRHSLKDSFVEKIFDICNKCKLKPGLPPEHPERLRQKRIQQRIANLIEQRPDLNFEERVHAAVEDEFDPHTEPNLAFRKYLIERRGL